MAFNMPFFKQKTPFQKTFGRRKLNFEVEDAIAFGKKLIKDSSGTMQDYHIFAVDCMENSLLTNPKMKTTEKMISIGMHTKYVRYTWRTNKLKYKKIKTLVNPIYAEIKEKLKDKSYDVTPEDYYWLTGQRYVDLMRMFH